MRIGLGIGTTIGQAGGGAPPSAPNPLAGVFAYYEADATSGSSPTLTWTDKSGNGRDATQQAGSITIGTGSNGFAQLTGNGSTYLNVAANLLAWPITIIAVATRTAGQTCGFVGAQGASPFNTFWTGYETTNRNAHYNSNANQNTTAEAGTRSLYVYRAGYGSRVAIVNNIIQSAQTGLPSIVRPAAAPFSIGTQYRGLNGVYQALYIFPFELSVAQLDLMTQYCNTKFGMSVPLFSDLTPAVTVAELGDSQAAGRVTTTGNVPVEYQGAQTDSFIFFGTPSPQGVGTAWNQYNIASNIHQLGDQQETSPTQFGPNVAFGKEIVDLLGVPVYNMHYARGGTFLDFNATFGYWDPFAATHVPSNTLRQYGYFVQNWWRSMAAHQAAGRRPDLRGIHMVLGYNDGSVSGSAAVYEANLMNFIPQLRAEMGYPNARIIQHRIEASNPISAHWATIRTAQENVAANLPNVVNYNSDDATNLGDGHFDAAGAVLIASRAAAIAAS